MDWHAVTSAYYMVTGPPAGGAARPPAAMIRPEIRAAYEEGHISHISNEGAEANLPLRDVLQPPGLDHRPARNTILTNSCSMWATTVLVNCSNMVVNGPRVCVQDRIKDWILHIIVRALAGGGLWCVAGGRRRGQPYRLTCVAAPALSSTAARCPRGELGGAPPGGGGHLLLQPHPHVCAARRRQLC